MTRTGWRIVVGVAAALAVVIAVGLLLVLKKTSDRTEITVDFEQSIGLYEGASVRILGVDVGRVTSVEPQGDHVQVKLWWDSDYKVPADAEAVIVNPSIVGDRFVQMVPAYHSGPTMKSGTTLDTAETAVPVELDQVYRTTAQLTRALGPNGANKNGAVSNLLKTGAQTLRGQGAKFNRLLANVSKLASTLKENKDPLFDSVRQLERFVGNLAVHDNAVRGFLQSSDELSALLAGERGDLQGALSALSGSLAKVRAYVANNKSALRNDVDALVAVTQQLVDQRENVGAILDYAPNAATNAMLGYDQTMGALGFRLAAAQTGTADAATFNKYIMTFPKGSPYPPGDPLGNFVAPVFCFPGKDMSKGPTDGPANGCMGQMMSVVTDTLLSLDYLSAVEGPQSGTAAMLEGGSDE